MSFAGTMREALQYLTLQHQQTLEVWSRQGRLAKTKVVLQLLQTGSLPVCPSMTPMPTDARTEMVRATLTQQITGSTFLRQAIAPVLMQKKAAGFYFLRRCSI